MMAARDSTAHTPSLPTSMPARLPRPPARRETVQGAPDPAALDLAALVKRSLLESERFYRGLQHDTCFAYELFRRVMLLNAPQDLTAFGPKIHLQPKELLRLFNDLRLNDRCDTKL